MEVKGTKVGIEMDGPSHFVNRESTGSTPLKRRQVSSLDDVHIVSVLYWEWDKLEMDRAKKQLFQAAVLAAIPPGVPEARKQPNSDKNPKRNKVVIDDNDGDGGGLTVTRTQATLIANAAKKMNVSTTKLKTAKWKETKATTTKSRRMCPRRWRGQQNQVSQRQMLPGRQIGLRQRRRIRARRQRQGRLC